MDIAQARECVSCASRARANDAPAARPAVAEGDRVGRHHSDGEYVHRFHVGSSLGALAAASRARVAPRRESNPRVPRSARIREQPEPGVALLDHLQPRALTRPCPSLATCYERKGNTYVKAMRKKTNCMCVCAYRH